MWTHVAKLQSYFINKKLFIVKYKAIVNKISHKPKTTLFALKLIKIKMLSIINIRMHSSNV